MVGSGSGPRKAGGYICLFAPAFRHVNARWGAFSGCSGVCRPAHIPTNNAAPRRRGCAVLRAGRHGRERVRVLQQPGPSALRVQGPLALCNGGSRAEGPAGPWYQDLARHSQEQAHREMEIQGGPRTGPGLPVRRRLHRPPAQAQPLSRQHRAPLLPAGAPAPAGPPPHPHPLHIPNPRQVRLHPTAPLQQAPPTPAAHHQAPLPRQCQHLRLGCPGRAHGRTHLLPQSPP